jgi:hypothetical protein
VSTAASGGREFRFFIHKRLPAYVIDVFWITAIVWCCCTIQFHSCRKYCWLLEMTSS